MPDYFTFASGTGDSYSIVVDSTSFGCELVPCDEIGIFDGDLCVGAVVFLGDWPLGLAAWKDDSETDTLVDGYAPGNPMTLRIWHAEENLESPVVEGDYSVGNGTFDFGPYARLWLDCPYPVIRGLYIVEDGTDTVVSIFDDIVSGEIELFQDSVSSTLEVFWRDGSGGAFQPDPISDSVLFEPSDITDLAVDKLSDWSFTVESLDGVGDFGVTSDLYLHGSLAYVSPVIPVHVASGPCCIGATGNVNFDASDIVDINDLTLLLNHLFITFEPLLCPAEANMNGDSACTVDVSDLTILVNALFITFEPLAVCNPDCE